MNSVFHPSKKNPFQVSPLPQSHYAPSPNKEILDKSVTLTPQKLKHRHEYSLPPEVYTPEQYSIHEEQSPLNKPPLPTYDKDDVVLNLQQILGDVETWDSTKFCEKWSSRISEVKEDIPSRKQEVVKPLIQGPLSSTLQSDSLKRSEGNIKQKPIRIQTSFVSDQSSSMDHDRTSNIQQRLERFRYGAPKAPHRRKAERCNQSIPNAVSVNHLRYVKKSQSSSPKDTKVVSQSPMKENVARFQHHGKSPESEYTRSSMQGTCALPKPPLPPTLESADLIDTSLSSLNSRLDRLIQQSSSVAISPNSTSKSAMDRSASSLLKVSSDSSTLSSDFAAIQISHLPSDSEPPRRMLWQKDDSKKRSAPVLKENDILYQWRLKRKLEEAREHIENNQGILCNGGKGLSKAERPFAAEASRVLQDSTSVNGICNNPATPHKHGTNFFHSPSRHILHSPHHLPAIKPMEFYQTPYGCPCVHLPPHLTHDCKLSVPELTKQDAAVGVTEMVSIETQTGRSLIFFDDGYSNDPATSKQGGSSDRKQAKSTCTNDFPPTSTPASAVSFHRVKIVEAEPDMSPQPAKDSSQAPNLSPVSYKTEATTLWSSVDRKRMDGARSPVSSVPSSHQRTESDADPCSPTANVVKEVVGAHLFNTSRSSSTNSTMSRLKKKLPDEKIRCAVEEEGYLNGSYTTSSGSENQLQSTKDDSPHPNISKQGDETLVNSPKSEHCSSHEKPNGPQDVKTPPITPTKPLSPIEELHHTEDFNKTLSESSLEEDCESDFDPVEAFDMILQGVKDDQSGLNYDDILEELRREKSAILEEFRQIADEIERCKSSQI